MSVAFLAIIRIFTSQLAAAHANTCTFIGAIWRSSPPQLQFRSRLRWSRKKREGELEVDVLFLFPGELIWLLLRWWLLWLLSVVGCGGGQSAAAIGFFGGDWFGWLMSLWIDSAPDELPPDVSVPVVLDIVVCSSGQSPRDQRPPAIGFQTLRFSVSV